jgi:hypothetical protein
MANELGLRPATIRLVALAVADVVNDAHDNEFYGSVTKLAAKVGLSRQCVGQVLKHLCDAGVLSQLEERPGGTTKYRWVGVTTTLSGSYPQPDNHADRYLTTTLSGGDNHVVTNPIEPKSEPKKTLPAAPEMSHFGSDGTEKEEKSGPAPSRVVVDHFELRWSQVVNRHKEYWSFPVVPLRAAAYTWVNSNYFRHKSLPPRPVSQVVALVDSFMQMVDTDQITPKKGYSIWQTFVANIAKLDNETVVLPEREIVY